MNGEQLENYNRYKKSYPHKTDAQIIESLAWELKDKVETIHKLLEHKKTEVSEEPYIKSVIIGEHKPDCKALEWKKENGYEPWDVNNLKKMTCNEKGFPGGLFKYVWYEMNCADATCECKKRVRARAIAEM